MRLVEAYVGEYASGKSEVAINRGLQLLHACEEVTLVDLDLVEPFYTLRTLKEDLEARGIRVVAAEAEEAYGLGETGNLFVPAMRWALRWQGCVIFDVGYGVGGSSALNLVEGVEEEENFQILAVVNPFRPLTSTPERIARFVHSLGQVNGLINNSNLGEETKVEDIIKGTGVVARGAALLQLPLVAAAVAERFKSPLQEAGALHDTDIRYLTLFYSGRDRVTKL